MTMIRVDSVMHAQFCVQRMLNEAYLVAVKGTELFSFCWVVLPATLLASSNSPASAKVTATMRSSITLINFSMMASRMSLRIYNTIKMPGYN